MHSRNNCSCGKTIGILYSECVSVALCIQYARCMCCIVICGLPGSTIFFRIISQTARFSKTIYRTYDVYFDFLYKFLSESFIILRRIQLDITINVHRHNRYSCHILGKLEFSWEIFEKYTTIKFHESPSSGSRVVPCGKTVGHTDTMKLKAVLLNFSEAPKDTPSCRSDCRVRFRIWSETYFEAHRLGLGHKYI